MTRTLLIIAGASFVLALATLSGAAAIGGRDMAAHGWAWTFHDKDGESVRFERADDQRGRDVTRTLAWTGGDKLVVDLSADVEYVQGDTPGIVVTGPADRVDKVRIDGERLTWAEGDRPNQERVVFGRGENGRGFWVDDGDVHIVVTAPAVKTFDLRGSSDVSIRGYDQPTLTIDTSGSGDITASGSTKALSLSMTGSGDADLADLLTEDADVSTTGSGDARIAPTGRADVSSSGSGDITLATRPATLKQSVSGSGDVRQD